MTDTSLLRYDRMVEDALRGVVREALAHVVEHGLPGDHHFYLTFRTNAPGVVMPDVLREQYPEEMTIVLQHQFWDLAVDATAFAVKLSFNNRPAELKVPLAALSAFVDPAVKFGLQFNVETLAGDGAPAKRSGSVPAVKDSGELVPVNDKVSGDESADEEAAKTSAEVVNLENFRKK